MFAYRHEIDEWLKSKTEPEADQAASETEFGNPAAASHDRGEAAGQAGNGATAEELPEHATLVSWKRAIVAVAAVAIAAASITLWATGGRLHRQPVAVSMEGNALVAYDDGGRELWRHGFPYPMAVKSYALFSQSQWVGDLNGDGENEVLFIYIPDSISGKTTALYCFSSTGKELWHYAPARSVRTGSESFSPDYAVLGFVVVSLPEGKRIVATSHHTHFYPNMISLLAPDGSTLREYWHSGGIEKLVVFDPMHDGKLKILAAGIDNEHRVATLVELDPEKEWGASRQYDARYQLMDMPIVNEAGRVYFPRGCISLCEGPYNGARDITVFPDRIRVSVIENPNVEEAVGLEFDLGYDLGILRVTAPDGYTVEHYKLEASGRLKHPYTTLEMGELARQYKDQAAFLKFHGPESESERLNAKK